MDSFEDVEEISDMPREELCSYCFGARLRMMQSSPYSAYDDMYAYMLEFVNQNCNVNSPTQILPNPVNINYTREERCEAERKYTVQNGDSCDSIAERHSVSGATLYYLNPELDNCTRPTVGLEICLPNQCERTYRVQSEEDDCVAVAIRRGATWNSIVDWNIGIDSRCSSLWSTSPFWGRVICVSPPGGEFVPPPPSDGTPGNGDIGGPGGSGDGYADVIVPPPEGGTVARGTTQQCRQYVQAEEGMGCEAILARSAVPMNLFLQPPALHLSIPDISPTYIFFPFDSLRRTSTFGRLKKMDDNLVDGLRPFEHEYIYKDEENRLIRDRAYLSIRENNLDALAAALAEGPHLMRMALFHGTYLGYAIKRDNLAATRMLLDHGLSPLEYEQDGGQRFVTSFEVASWHGNRAIWRLLLDRFRALSPTGVEIGPCNEQDLIDRCLATAALSGKTVIVADFLDELQWSQEALRNALLHATQRWQADVVDLLLVRCQFDKDTLQKALEVAVDDRDNFGLTVKYKADDWDKHYRTVCRLVDGSGVDLRSEAHGSPLLFQAVGGSKHQKVLKSSLLVHQCWGFEKQGALRALLEKGADPNTQWDYGMTALHLFAYPTYTDHLARPVMPLGGKPRDGFNMYEVGIKLLIEHGASTTTRDNDGATAVHLAAEGADTDIFIRYYMAAGTDLTSTNQYGESILHYAAAGGKAETLSYLLSRYGDLLDVNATNATGWTPLICALAPNSRVEKDEVAAVKSSRLLLSYGAKVDAVTAEGWTILHVLGSYQDYGAYRAETPDPTDLDGYSDPDFGHWTMCSNEEWGFERSKLLDSDSSAEVLARELLSTYSHSIPPIESPAKLYDIRHKVVNYGFWDQHPSCKIAWGGQLNKLLAETREPLQQPSGVSMADEIPSLGGSHIPGMGTRKWEGHIKHSKASQIKTGRTPLHWAAEHGAAGVARVLRELARADTRATDGEGKTPWDLAHGYSGNKGIRNPTENAVAWDATPTRD
ncbi:hypothetical protein S40293_10024 [Stachybotrys chartarum IBT 40293]|nr:hypothetical protein S40293_10024 [Stachybotrys chartarum IBT 40293]